MAHETGRVQFHEDDPNVPEHIKSMWSDAMTDIVVQYWCPELENVRFWALEISDLYLFHSAGRYRGTLIDDLILGSNNDRNQNPRTRHSA